MVKNELWDFEIHFKMAPFQNMKKMATNTTVIIESIIENGDTVECWPKETLTVLFYEAKVPFSDGHSTI